MPVTTIDTETALIVIDLQEGIVNSPFIHPTCGVIERSCTLIDLLPELNMQPGDIVVTKQTWGAFPSTDLENPLKAKGVMQVVLVGVATGTGVEATARQAYEQGFHVTLAIDAITDARPEAHAYSLAHVFPCLGETGTTQEIIDLLPKRSSK